MSRKPEMLEWLKNTAVLTDHVMRTLHERVGQESIFPKGISNSPDTSGVLFTLGRLCSENGEAPEPCVLLNKRSIKVKQPGDLCFPGGRTAPTLDFYLSKLLALPFSTLRQWPYWRQWRDQRPVEARRLALVLATSLRESFEEMRLNPIGVKFLGPLPPQNLVVFHRVIYPMVGWITHQNHFFPNWEVERVVYIPLRDLLSPEHYARYRLKMGPGRSQDFPCFLHRDRSGEEEVLWGATYRIVRTFIAVVFDFTPPHAESLPIIRGSLDEAYLQGAA